MNTKILLILAVISVIIVAGCAQQGQQTAQNETKTYKILHVMSYHTPWEWTEEQLAGFKEQLADLNVEYMVYEMDTKRQSTVEWKEKAGAEARALIDSWEPDLVYTNDDNAQIYVTKYYINSSIPFVFGAVNAEPETYGFAGSTNIAGVLEREHSVETLNFLREIVPSIKRVAIISDTDPTWPPIIDRVKKRFATELPDVEVASADVLNTYTEYKQTIKGYENRSIDLVLHLGDFTYKNESGQNVPFEQLEEWTTKNSNIPDASFWNDRVLNGYLAAMTISGHEQGKEAGLMARRILVDGETPSQVGFKPTAKGQPVVNLARARGLNITIKSTILLSAKIFEEFPWEK